MTRGKRSVRGGASELDLAQDADLKVGEADECDAQKPRHRGGGAETQVVVGLFPDGQAQYVRCVSRAAEGQQEDAAHALERRDEGPHEVDDHQRQQLREQLDRLPNQELWLERYPELKNLMKNILVKNGKMSWEVRIQQ